MLKPLIAVTFGALLVASPASAGAFSVESSLVGLDAAHVETVQWWGQQRPRYQPPPPPRTRAAPAPVVRQAPAARLAPGAAASVRSNQSQLIQNRVGGGRLLANDGGGIVAGGAGNFRGR